MRTGTDRLSAVAWSLNGSALTFSYSGPLDDCYFPNQGLAALVPGHTRRALVRPRHCEIVRYAESPDGRYLAVDLKPRIMSRESERRAKRRPWRTNVARNYGTGSRRADAAVSRVILRATRALRRGASRHTTLIGVRLGLGRIEERYSGVGDSDVTEQIANELDGWLTAAGLHGIDALDEIECD